MHRMLPVGRPRLRPEAEQVLVREPEVPLQQVGQRRQLA